MNKITLINEEGKRYIFNLNSVIIKDGKLYELLPDELEKYNDGTYFQKFLDSEYETEFDLDLYVHNAPYCLSEYKVIMNVDKNIECSEDKTIYTECDICGDLVDEDEIKEGMCGYCFSFNVGDDY